MAGTPASTVDDYVAALPADVVPLFEQVRATIVAVAPGATETIKYGIPAWTLYGKAFVHLGAWKQHLSLYPVPAMGEDLARRLVPHLSGRGTLRFPFTTPLPLPEIEAVVRLLVDQRTELP
jgi:uncharacterized protein YdhG (YjbR/CyaY superfamily)